MFLILHGYEYFKYHIYLEKGASFPCLSMLPSGQQEPEEETEGYDEAGGEDLVCHHRFHVGTS